MHVWCVCVCVYAQLSTTRYRYATMTIPHLPPSPSLSLSLSPLPLSLPLSLSLLSLPLSLSLSLCTATSIWTATYVDQNVIFFPYTTDSANPALEGFIRFWTFIILFQVSVHTYMHVFIPCAIHVYIYFCGEKLV